MVRQLQQDPVGRSVQRVQCLQVVRQVQQDQSDLQTRVVLRVPAVLTLQCFQGYR